MASSKPAPTTRRSRAKTPAGADQPQISTATWAGVALVIAALLGAISLAVLSPSEPDQVGQAGVAPIRTPVASAAPADDRVPTAQPEIIAPAEGLITGEWEIAVSVAVPDDPLAKRLLSLEILRDGVVLADKRRPDPVDQTLEGIRLVEGENVITAALKGPGGRGPLSPPVTVHLDRTPPTLTVATPKDNRKTTDTSVRVTGTSDPGAKVHVRNTTKDWEDPAVVGPSGSFEVVAPLARGENRIVVRAIDVAGNVRRITRFVVQQDARPVVKLKAPKNVKISALPTNLRIHADVSDANGKAIAGADVVFSVTVPGQSSEVSEAETNANGRATLLVEVPKGGRRDEVIRVNARVTAPNGLKRNASVEIKYS